MYDWIYCEIVLEIYSFIMCEAKFSKVRVEMFKCTWVKCLLETNLASCVKPSNINEQMNERTNEWTNERTNERTNEWMNEYIYSSFKLK